MNLEQWVSHHKRSILFLLLIATIGGVFSAFNLPVALFPEVNFPRVAINIEAGDQPAERMVTEITRPIEQAVKSVPGLHDIRSTTSRGSADLSLTFDWGRDMDLATLQIQSALSRILPTLPPGTNFVVRRMNPSIFPVAAYSLTSDTVDQVKLRDIAQYSLQPLLSSINGVASADITGGGIEEYRVDINQGRLTSYGLKIDDVITALSAANILAVTGKFEDRHKLLLALSNSQMKTLDDVGATVLKSQPKGVIRLSDVATIYKSTAPNWTAISTDGKPAVIMQVYQQPNGNTVQIVRDINTALQKYEQTIPASIKVSNWYDQSELIVDSAASVRDAILIGIVLAGIVLLLFLRSLKITLITLIVVPAVLASTILFMSVLGMSFNIMTLGGMAAAIGLIIDDAIVMIEQIVRNLKDDGRNARDQIRQSVHEFLKPLAGSSAATIVIFLPLAFLSGVTGAFFKALSLTMGCALVVSFFIAWVVIPLLADYLMTKNDAHNDSAGPVFGRILKAYQSVFKRLQAAPRLLLLPLAALVVLGVLAFTQVGSGFMPAMDEGGFILDYFAPPGTSLKDTDALLQQVNAILQKTPEVLTYSRRTGAQLGGGLTETNTGDFFVRLKPMPRRAIDEVMQEVLAKAQEQIPGLRIELAQLMEDVIGDLTAVPQPVEIQIYGDNQQTLLKIAPNVAAAIKDIQGISEIRNGVVVAGDALNIEIDRVKAGLEGLDPDAVNRQIGTFLSGNQVTKIQDVEKTIDVRVWIPEQDRSTINDIRRLLLTAPDGHKIPLGRIATISLLTGQPEITRDNLKPMVAVTARIEGRDMGSTVADVKKLLDKSALFPAGTYYELGGLYAQQQIAFKGLMAVLIAAFALVFTLLLFLYERFDITVSIILMPLFAMIAVLTGLWVTGIELNISALMGMTMVVGIVTEVAIFYFSEYTMLIHSGIPPNEALMGAGVNRFRPIAMTTLAAILALLPLALGLGQGSAMQQPLAIAIISGLILQLPLVLLVMPFVFMSLERLSKKTL